MIKSKKIAQKNYAKAVKEKVVIPKRMLCHASKKTGIHKNLEAIFIVLLKPSLNEQKNFERLILFRDGIT